MRKTALSIVLLAGLVPAAQAWELSAVRDDGQADFRDVTLDMLGAIGFKNLRPASVLPTWSWGIGAYGSTTFVDDHEVWKSSVGSSVDTVNVAGLTGYVQLPRELQLGALAAAITDTDDQLYALDLRYPLLKKMGGFAVLSARASASVVYGVEDIHLSSQALELIGSHQRGALTPYAGLGVVFGQFNPSSDTELSSENPVRPRLLAGASWALNGFDLSGEVEQTGRNTSLALRLSAGF